MRRLSPQGATMPRGAPHPQSVPNRTRARCPGLQLIGNLVDSGLHALLIPPSWSPFARLGDSFVFCVRPREWMIGGFSMRRAFAWVLCGVAVSACSAIPGPSGSNRGTISLESDPPGAEARLSSSGASCRTPCTLPVKVSDYNVTFALAGYTPRFYSNPRFDQTGALVSPEVTCWSVSDGPLSTDTAAARIEK